MSGRFVPLHTSELLRVDEHRLAAGFARAFARQEALRAAQQLTLERPRGSALAWRSASVWVWALLSASQ
jgi:hypothetical protein